jgi:hypothetical protein
MSDKSSRGSGRSKKRTAKGRSKPPAVEKRVRASEATEGPPRAEVWSRILARRLRGGLDAEVDVAITDNTHTMVAFSRQGRRYRVRLHHMFLRASPEVVAALGRYIRGDEDGSEVIDAFIDRHRYLVRRVPPRIRQRRLRIEPRGAHHDLSEIFERLDRRFFRGEVRATITWATVPRVRRPRKSIKLGSYSEDTRIIRIHPALDHPLVPRFFVEWIVFHEMLHVVEGAECHGGRRVVHTERFNRRERRFPSLARARAWEREHIDWLLAWQPRPRRRVGGLAGP